MRIPSTAVLWGVILVATALLNTQVTIAQQRTNVRVGAGTDLPIGGGWENSYAFGAGGSVGAGVLFPSNTEVAFTLKYDWHRGKPFEVERFRGIIMDERRDFATLALTADVRQYLSAGGSASFAKPYGLLGVGLYRAGEVNPLSWGSFDLGVRAALGVQFQSTPGIAPYVEVGVDRVGMLEEDVGSGEIFTQWHLPIRLGVVYSIDTGGSNRGTGRGGDEYFHK